MKYLILVSLTIMITACSMQSLPFSSATPTVDFTRFRLDLPQEPQFGDPVRPPTESYVTVSITGLVEGTKQTRIAVFDLEEGKAWWIHQYLSLDWGEAELQWSPDGNWIALVPQDAAFSNDCGLWIFSVDGTEVHQFHQAQFMNKWSKDSQRISFQLKDFCGYVDVTDWEVYPCP